MCGWAGGLLPARTVGVRYEVAVLHAGVDGAAAPAVQRRNDALLQRRNNNALLQRRNDGLLRRRHDGLLRRRHNNALLQQ